jgi:hypothetical protein
VLCFAVGFAGESQAGIIINIQQVAPDVVLATTVGGTLNVSGLTPYFDTVYSGAMAPNLLAIGMGQISTFQGEFTSFSFITTGPIGGTLATYDAGGPVGFVNYANFNEDLIGVPKGSVDSAGIASIGMVLSNFTGYTLDSLGLSPGVYTVGWGTGPNQDSITVNVIAPAAVPEPGTAAIGLILGGAAMFRRFRKRRA